MKARISRFSAIAMAFALSAVIAQAADQDFEISWYTIDSGGGLSSAGAFTLEGTIGQSDASRRMMTGGQYAVSGGFWENFADLIFSDGFEVGQ